MEIHRIYGILLRHIFLLKHSIDKKFEIFVFPTLDLLVWGITSIYIQQRLPSFGQVSIMTLILSGLLLWIVVWRSYYEVASSLLEELWNKNLVNLFVAPLRFEEWAAALLAMGFLKGILSMLFGVLMAVILYHFFFLQYAFSLIPLILLLIMTGWWAGFVVASLIFRFGSKVQALAWTALIFISPFSAVYYPLSTLPNWAQTISHVLPTSYVFEQARRVVNGQGLQWDAIIIATSLNIIYLVLSFLFFRRSFQAVLKKGLIKIF